MSTSESRVVAQVVNTARYPLSQPAGAGWKRVVSHIQHELQNLGCSVLPDFIQPVLHDALRRESGAILPNAYYEAETVNAYNIAVDPALPEDHPGRIAMERGNAFVPRDCIPKDAIIHRLYTCPLFQRFIASCFELERVYELADPLSALCLNVVAPGKEHPWHFDTNEFTVSLLTQQQEAGGIFEYCPNIRSAATENFEDVRAVLEERDPSKVRRLILRPGDLQLFKGRYSLHRVSAVHGRDARLSAIFAYTERPGVIGSIERTRQLFGRVLPEHQAAAGHAVRVDPLLD